MRGRASICGNNVRHFICSASWGVGIRIGAVAEAMDTECCAIRTRYLKIAGYRTFMREAGARTPLVLLPSMLVLSRSYRPIIGELARSFRVICPEFPGVGHGSEVGPPWSFEEYA